MASNTQDEILKEFEMLSWQTATLEGADEHSTSELDPGGTARRAAARPEIAGAAATPAGQNIRGGSESRPSSDGGSTVATVIKDIFETGLGVVPLIGGLLGLFGGGSDTPPEPVKYQMPSRISFMSADVRHELLAADYDQMGLARQYDSSDYGIADLAASDAAPAPARRGVPYQSPAADTETPTSPQVDRTGNAASARQVTVNVQAMDAQSFLDRSHDIAEAVRSAMLNMSSINDVVNDL